MQQRRVRLGDIVDDYCPRERRITNHAVVAMIEDEVKQTRCTTCDADHEYKRARIPPQRRKRGAAEPESAEGALRPRPPIEEDAAPDETPAAEAQSEEPFEAPSEAELAEAEPEPDAAAGDDDGPVHRRLIRATLPRPDGQMPERKEPDFTIRQSGFRGRGFDSHKNGHRHGPRQMRGQQSPFGTPRQGSGQAPRQSSGQAPRHGSGQAPRHGSGHGPGHGPGQGPRHGAGGSRPGSGPGHRPPGNRPAHPGGPRGNRPGAGRGGRKRGR